VRARSAILLEPARIAQHLLEPIRDPASRFPGVHNRPTTRALPAAATSPTTAHLTSIRTIHRVSAPGYSSRRVRLIRWPLDPGRPGLLTPATLRGSSLRPTRNS